jgi:hypothetical protein
MTNQQKTLLADAVVAAIKETKHPEYDTIAPVSFTLLIKGRHTSSVLVTEKESSENVESAII